MNYVILITLCLISALLLIRAGTAQNLKNMPGLSAPIVIELFTSQSCSSCPPADKLLSELAQKNNIIALGCHVSYWNHLNWKDTLSQDFCDMRQHGYAGFKGTRRIYTPQMIVNGSDEFVGSNAASIISAIKRTENAPLKTIQIGASSGNIIRISLPAITNGNYRLWAYGFKNSVHQTIKNGENGGKSIAYSNPVSSYNNLGGWDGNAATLEFPKPENIDSIAILAQEGGYGPIIAAGKLDF